MQLTVGRVTTRQATAPCEHIGILAQARKALFLDPLNVARSKSSVRSARNAG